MRAIPEELLTRPFHRSEALAAGVTARIIEGARFRRVHEAVYRHRDLQLTHVLAVQAAALALPASARTTGITRIQQLGVDHGPRLPLHFVVQGDLHLDLAGVFLHRTVKMPPVDEVGVSPEAALVAYCAEARMLDAVKIGSWMLHLGHLDLDTLDQVLDDEKWRRGVAEMRWVLPMLVHRCRSLPEAELFALLTAAGFPAPEVNLSIEIAPGLVITPDLWFGDFRRAVEYEGSHHQEDRGQYSSDLARYAAYRRAGIGYVQVTREQMRSPKSVVRMVHRELIAGGYSGPAPDFGARWSALFAPLRDVVRPPRASGA